MRVCSTDESERTQNSASTLYMYALLKAPNISLLSAFCFSPPIFLFRFLFDLFVANGRLWHKHLRPNNDKRFITDEQQIPKCRFKNLKKQTRKLLIFFHTEYAWTWKMNNGSNRMTSIFFGIEQWNYFVQIQ